MPGSGSLSTLPSVQVFIPWADDGSSERRHSLHLVQDFYDAVFPDWPLDLATSDVLFPRAQAVNAAARHSTADVLVFNDADSLVAPAQLEDAVRAAATGELVRAYTRYCRVDEFTSAACQTWADALAQTEFYWVQENTVSHGVMAIHRQTFIDLGGYDPRFHYFYDDCSLDLRAGAAGLRMPRIPGDLVHLWHPAREPFADDEALWRRYEHEDPELVRAEVGWTV